LNTHERGPARAFDWKIGKGKSLQDIPQNSDILATLFGGFWADLPMISRQSALKKNSIFLPLIYRNSG
jgi:hypothetical protein